MRERFGDGSIDRTAGGGLCHLDPILLQRGDMVAVEEPEAHLHAPTTGRGMRDCLLRVEKNGIIDQLFVATHSNLFDLDPDGYWDVRINEETKSTLIARSRAGSGARPPPSPGPMKRVLRVMLEQYRDDARVMFLARDGKKVTAAELIHHLDDDDDLALEYVRGLYSAAMELYGRQARRAASDRRAAGRELAVDDGGGGFLRAARSMHDRARTRGVPRPRGRDERSSAERAGRRLTV